MKNARQALLAGIWPEESIKQVQVQMVYDQFTESMGLSLLVAWSLALMIHRHVPPSTLLVWLGLLSVVLVTRYLLARRYMTSPASGPWIVILLLGAAATGLLWGSAGLFLYHAPANIDIVIILAVTMVTVSAMAFLGQYLPAYLTFLVFATVPMIVFVTTNLAPGSAISVLLYVVFMVAAGATSLRFNFFISERVRLQAETMRLNETLETRNRELENELQRRRETQRELTRNKEYIDAIFANAPVEMYLKDRQGRYIKINRQFERIFGVHDADVHGKLPFDVHDAELARRTHEHDMAVLSRGITEVIEQPCRLPGLPDDGEHTLLTVKFPVETAHGEVNGLGAVVFDITHQKNIEAQLRRSRERFRDFAEIASDYYWEADAEMNLTYTSTHGRHLNGVPMSELIGSVDGQVSGGRIVIDNAWLDHVTRRENRNAYELEVSYVRNDDKEFRIFISARPVVDADEEFLGYRGIARDITREYRLQQESVYQANHDPLTGQYNRRKFLHCVDEFLEDARGSSRVHLLCYLDLDRFKFVNDSSGHVAGDALLVEVSNVIRKHIRDEDVLGRIGGDEFGILLRNCSTTRGSSIANQVIKKLQGIDFHWNGRRYSISASVGISIIDSSVASATTLLSDADQACYRAKDLGEGRVFVSSRTRGAPNATRHYRHTDWLDAFDKSLIELYAQPIVPLGNRQAPIRWYELLIRLVDTTGEIHVPEYFVPYAERFGQITRVDQWVVVNAFEQIRDVRGWRDCRFSINLSGASLHSDKLRRDILDQFVDGGVPPENICFEITETSAIKNLSLARTFIERLRGEGCHLALDDFGTGLASFSYLKHFPVDFVKIDGSFIQDLQRDPYNPVFVESICSVASAMNIKTVGECVESAEFLERLAEIGVDFAQGYAIGEPRPLSEL